MQCKETHKCNRNKITWVRVKFSKSPAESPETVDAPWISRAPCAKNGAGFRFVHLGLPQFGLKCRGSEIYLTKCDVRPITHHRVQIRIISLENWFLIKKCQTWTALPDTESPPKYFILGEFRKPWLVPKATCPSSPKLPRLGNLGTRGEGHVMSTPARPIKDRPVLSMISCFWKHMCSSSD